MKALTPHEIRQLGLDERRTYRQIAAREAERCRLEVERRKAEGLDPTPAETAWAHWAAAEVTAAATTVNPGAPYQRARDIVDVPTAQAAIKAGNRLIGLLEAEHHCVAALLDVPEGDSDHEEWAALEAAHDRVELAFEVGGSDE